MSNLRQAAQQALEFCEFLWREVALNDWAEGQREALENNLRAALAEPDLDHCPKCGGPADNGHDRCIPPNPYFCSKCMTEPEQQPIGHADLGINNIYMRRSLSSRSL